jgi:hypothetical protein
VSARKHDFGGQKGSVVLVLNSTEEAEGMLPSLNIPWRTSNPLLTIKRLTSRRDVVAVS